MFPYVFDSLTKKIIPLELSKSETIKWYSCGPTVYDMAHLGHARNFMTFDIIKRILVYMGYNIEYVMNITDIDDKIINRINLLPKNGNIPYDLFLKFVRNIETDFWNDMETLNIIKPNVITRVTENINNIIAYINTIIDNGYAYKANGSVYFDSEKFRNSGKNFRPLAPCIIEDNNLQESEFMVEKKSPNDFALWKAAKPNEIQWDSIFGSGRPGWHIECSVMASNILSNTFDIHSGGIDLMFPHHNNEIVQAQSYQNKDNNDFCWAKYFLHSGQLTVNGKKMAKSGGNYITIKDFLVENPDPNILRILFLLHEWNKPFDYSADKLNLAKHSLKKINNFINTFKIKLKNKKVACTQTDNVYMENIINYKKNVTDSLYMNFDTPSVLRAIINMMHISNIYLKEEYNYDYVYDFVKHALEILEMFGLEFKKDVEVDTEKWISLYTTFKNSLHDYINNNESLFSESAKNSMYIILKNNNSDNFIEIIVNLRASIRNYLKNNSKEFSKESFNYIFKMLDDLRDIKVKDLGVFIEDRNEDKVVKWYYI